MVNYMHELAQRSMYVALLTLGHFAWQGHTGRIALILLHENVTNGAFQS